MVQFTRKLRCENTLLKKLPLRHGDLQCRKGAGIMICAGGPELERAVIDTGIYSCSQGVPPVSEDAAL